MAVARVSIVAVIVTYEPDLDALERLLRAVSPQVDAAIVVDNGSRKEISQWLARQGIGNLYCRRLPENQGVAAAQNLGIAWAKGREATHVILFDQDSLPAPDMIHCLGKALEELEQGGRRVCAVGPRYQDQKRRRSPPFVRIRGLFIGRCHCRSDDEILEVDHLIASGSLIPMAVLEEVGEMVEALFIDYIDIEWVLRARQKNYRAYGVCGARMFHVLGDHPIRFLGREVVARSPLRHYYMFRNAVWIYRQGWVPFLWKLADGIRLLQRFCFYALLARPRRAHVKMMCLGLWHGWLGRMGGRRK